jgi:hypothetical protein
MLVVFIVQFAGAAIVEASSRRKPVESTEGQEMMALPPERITDSEGGVHIGHSLVTEAVTILRGPPHFDVSTPRAVTMFVKGPQRFALAGKLPPKKAVVPAFNLTGSDSGIPLLPINVNGPTILSTTVTLVSEMSPQFLTVPIKSTSRPELKQLCPWG